LKKHWTKRNLSTKTIAISRRIFAHFILQFEKKFKVKQIPHYRNSSEIQTKNHRNGQIRYREHIYTFKFIARILFKNQIISFYIDLHRVTE